MPLLVTNRLRLVQPPLWMLPVMEKYPGPSKEKVRPATGAVVGNVPGKVRLPASAWNMNSVPPTFIVREPGFQMLSPATFSMAGTKLLRPLQIKVAGLTLMLPSVPFNCRVELPGPWLLRIWIVGTPPRALVELMSTTPSLAVGLAVSTFKMPVSVLLPLKTSVPGSAFVSDVALTTWLEMVRVTPASTPMVPAVTVTPELVSLRLNEVEASSSPTLILMWAGSNAAGVPPSAWLETTCTSPVLMVVEPR